MVVRCGEDDSSQIPPPYLNVLLLYSLPIGEIIHPESRDTIRTHRAESYTLHNSNTS